MPLILQRPACASLLTAALFFAAGAALAATNSPVWFASTWQSDDGLPDNIISGVTQTADGYLWVATHGGLVRFDGARFEEFSLVNLAGTPHRVIRAQLRPTPPAACGLPAAAASGS